jgi:hypothetical protein
MFLSTINWPIFLHLYKECFFVWIEKLLLYLLSQKFDAFDQYPIVVSSYRTVAKTLIVWVIHKTKSPALYRTPGSKAGADCTTTCQRVSSMSGHYKNLR